MNEILFGHDPEQYILAVAQHSESSVMVYRREDGRVTATEREFFPFFHISDDKLLDGFSRKHWLKKLEGTNFYQSVCAFGGTQDMWDAVRFIIEKINRAQGRHVTSFAGIDDLYLRPFPVTQYLMQSGKTLFKGMAFDDVHRLQIDIRTYAKDHRLSRPERKEDRILTIALCDNRGWEQVLGAKSLSEPELLRRFVEAIRDRDPDVIEGEHLFNHVLPYLMKRCELQEIEPGIGRDGSAPTGSASRTAFGEFDVEYITYEVAGRHLIDLWLLKQSREGSGSPTTKTAVAPGDHGISTLWEKSSADVKERGLEAARDVRSAADQLSGEIFHLAKMLPYNYGTVARLGAAAKIDALMLREYLRLRHSIPKPESGAPLTAVSSEIYYTGVFNTVLQIEPESLYPRLLLAQEVHPSTDPLHTFQSILRQLMAEHGKAAHAEESNAYRMLIDSLYPYLHHRRNIFSDQERGSEIARDARELLARAIREIELHNGIVIQMEETTLFCQPPDNVAGEKAELAFAGHVGSQLPEEVHLEVRGRYRRMASYRKHNYGLLDYDERMTIHGTALNPRTIERFGRSYIQMGLDCILRLDFENLHRLYVELQQSIRERQLDIADIVRTETLHDPLDVYRQEVTEEKRNRVPAYEAALRSSRSIVPGDKIAYYFSSRAAHQREAEAAREASEWDPNFPDEDTAYYLKRLEDFSKRFEVFLAEKDFQRIFSSDDLFGFEGEPIIPLMQKQTADSSSAAADSRIMLDL